MEFQLAQKGRENKPPKVVSHLMRINPIFISKFVFQIELNKFQEHRSKKFGKENVTRIFMPLWRKKYNSVFWVHQSGGVYSF